jgi:Flp pilus assembly secretin CpaC/tetratricopeptide (TPR) repeat protein
LKTQRLFSALVVVASLGLGLAAAAGEDEFGSSVPRRTVDVVIGAPATQPELRMADTSDPSSSQVLKEAIELRDVIWQRAKATAQEYSDRARMQIKKSDELKVSDDDFNSALKLIDNADAELLRNSNVAPPAELKGLRDKLAELHDYVLREQDRINELKVKQQKDEAAAKAIKQQEDMERQRKAQIDSLMNQVLRARVENNYPTAIDLLNRVLKIEPDYRVARWMLDDAKINLDLTRQVNIDATADEWGRKSLLSVREALTPYDDPIVYPTADVWHELTERRRDYAAGMPPDPTNQRLRDVMKKNIPEIKFPKINFEDALKFLGDLERVNINPNWAAMEAVGITKDTQIDLNLHDVSFQTALTELLVKAAGKEGILDYMLKGGVLKISTNDDLTSSKNLQILVYDVRDLLHPLTDFKVPKASRTLSTGGDNTGKSGDDSGIFGDDDDNAAASDDSGTREEDRAKKVEDFTGLLRATVNERDGTVVAWDPQGEGILKEIDGLLVVKQSFRGHEQIVGLLNQLREHSRMQIAIETRFLTIESQFLEDIGFDLDFIFQGGEHTSKIPVDVSTFTHGTLDKATGSFLDSNGVTTLQPVGSADIFEVGRSSLVVAGSFLDDIQIDFFLRATQAHRQSTRLNSLRVTLMNGHEAYVLVQTETDYVSDLTPQTGANIAAFAPSTDVLIAGVSFGVRATITADRKYVIMTVYPTLRDDTLAGTFKFQTGIASTSSITTTGNTGGTVVNPGNAPIAAQEAEIQLRKAAIQEVRTTVMVPDKGTLVLGGQRIADELEVETGVPILSKIPIIKRAFTTRTFVKRERTLLILIRPQILIPEELEP